MPTHIPEIPVFDWAQSPGTILQMELAAQSMSQAQLAARTGLSPKHVNLVVKGHAPISADVAVSLERVLGTPAQVWLRVESTYQAHEARVARAEMQSTPSFLEWARKFPREVLEKRGVIAHGDDGAVLVEKVLDFFGVTSPDAFEKAWLEPQASYRRSQKFTISPLSTALWIRLVEVEADKLASKVAEYDAKKLAQVAKRIPALTRLAPAKGFRRAQRELLDAGVTLVFVPEVPDTRINGMTRVYKKRHVIAVTSRHRSFDILWFTVLHELAHVLLHPKRATFLDIGKASDNDDAQEAIADAFAADTLIPSKFNPQIQDLSSTEELASLAEELNLGPGILAGRRAFLRNEWGGPFAKFRETGDLEELLEA